MSNTLPITIQMAALPPQVKWKVQQLADAMAARMSLVTSQTFALFVTGSTAPTSNVGPWLKNGTEWWVWDSGTGAYVPITLNQQSLGYYIGSGSPDPTLYEFWIETTAGGSPLAIKIYYSGAWVDVYSAVLASYMTVAAYNAAIANYSTTAQMNAAISAAVSASAGQGVFKASPSVIQNVIFAGAGNQAGQVTLGAVAFNPDASFAASKFTAPATGYYTFAAVLYASVSAGAPANTDIRAFFGVNGAAGDTLNDDPLSSSLNGRAYVGSTVLYLSAGDEVDLRYDITVDAAATIDIDNAYTYLTGYRIR